MIALAVFLQEKSGRSLSSHQCHWHITQTMAVINVLSPIYILSQLFLQTTLFLLTASHHVRGLPYTLPYTVGFLN
jgi:hypothetical protein